MKRLIAFFSMFIGYFVVCLAVLVGCSGEGPGESTSTTNPPGPEVTSDHYSMDAHYVHVDGVTYVCITLNEDFWCDLKVESLEIQSG